METAAREFQIMVKTVGAICNLDCHYCYYLKKESLYPKGSVFRMNDELLEKYISQHIRATPTEIVSFSWHGGEPTLIGIEFFHKAVELQKKHLPPNKKLINGIQTNGVLIDDRWCEFLAQENFYIGLSLDGPKDLHDRYRVTKGQKPTHKQVVQAFHRLRRHKVHVDLLCVVHDVNVKHPIAVYRHLQEIGGEYLQFLPLVERADDPERSLVSRSVPAAAYGEFLCTIFDEWVRKDVGRIFIQLFDESVRPFLGMEHALCIYRETCGNVPVVEHNGDFYSCDHYVLPEYKIGNINEQSLADLVEHPAQRDFGQRKWTTLPRFCRECEVLSMCNGGCPKDRFIKTPDGEDGLNYLCAGLKRFFTHTRSYFQKFAKLVDAGEPTEKLMEFARAEDAQRGGQQVGRNDPCPCGSGKKYKRCCLDKTQHAV